MGRNVELEHLRGLKANMPVLFPGELYLCTDTLEVFIGTIVSGNISVRTPVFNAAGTRLANQHIVQGTVTIPGGGSIVVTLVGGAVYTSGASYTCVATCTNAKHAAQVTTTSGTQITFMGATGDVFDYICIGN